MVFLNLGKVKGKAMMGWKLLHVVGGCKEVRETSPRLACSKGTFLKSINCHNFFYNVMSNLPLKFYEACHPRFLDENLLIFPWYQHFHRLLCLP